MDNIFNRAHEIYNSFFNPYKNLTPTELNNKLLEASKKGNLSEVTALLGYGADINTTDDDKRTPLMWACANEHPDIVAYLLEKKTNTKLKDRNGLTALIFAAKSNKNTFILEYLIKNGVDIKATDKWGDNSLMFTCKNGHTDAAALLLQNGADIKATNHFGINALGIACMNGHTGTAAFLLQNGADIKARDNSGNNAFMLTCSNGHTDTVEWLIKNDADIKATNHYGNKGFMLACSNGHTGTAELLIKNGADINAKNTIGDNALGIACMHGHTGTVEFLINNGADIHQKNIDGNNPLIIACMNGHTGTAELLIKNGADIKATNNFRCNALGIACLAYKTDTAYLLLNRMTPEEREEFANKHNQTLAIVNNFKENLRENALSVFRPWKKANETLFCVFEQLPFELRVIISAFSAQLNFKNSWYRFSAFDTMNLGINLCKPGIKDKIILPVLFSSPSTGKRKAEGEPEENNRPAKKICSGEKMETDESPKLTIFSNKK